MDDGPQKTRTLILFTALAVDGGRYYMRHVLIGYPFFLAFFSFLHHIVLAAGFFKGRWIGRKNDRLS